LQFEAVVVSGVCRPQKTVTERNRDLVIKKERLEKAEAFWIGKGRANLSPVSGSKGPNTKKAKGFKKTTLK